MKLKMNDNSIFAVLLRSPWWISGALAAALFMLARLALPAEYTIYSLFFALPFLVIAVVTAWQQFRAPSQARIDSVLDSMRAMSWADFASAVEQGFQREGYTVMPMTAGGVDFELGKAGRTTLVGCKRWKVARTGVEPLRELDAARERRDAQGAVYIATGEVTSTAMAFAAEKQIRILAGADLVKFMPRTGVRR